MTTNETTTVTIHDLSKAERQNLIRWTNRLAERDATTLLATYEGRNRFSVVNDDDAIATYSEPSLEAAHTWAKRAMVQLGRTFRYDVES